jgi:hypothetical protein
MIDFSDGGTRWGNMIILPSPGRVARGAPFHLPARAVRGVWE